MSTRNATILCRQRAANLCPHPEGREISTGDKLQMDRIRIGSAAGSAHREVGAIRLENGGDVLKNLGQLLVARNLLTRERIASNRGLVPFETEQGLWMSDGQRPHQEGVETAEDGGICADS